MAATARRAAARTAPLAEALTDGDLLRLDGFIGDWVGAEDRFAVTDPASGEVVAEVARLGAGDARAAVEAAQAAFAGWSVTLPQDRAALLRRWYELIVAHREDLARIMVAEQGKPLSEALGEIDYGASFVEFYAEEARRPNIEGVTSHLPDAEVETASQSPSSASIGRITPRSIE